MKYVGKNSLSSYFKIFIILLMFAAVAVVLGLPILLKRYISWLNYIHLYDISYKYLLLILYISGISSLFILNELRKIFNTLENYDPFVLHNVKSLKTISNFCFLIGIVYVSKIFILNSFMTLIIVLVFIVCGILALVLSEVFNQAVKYKEDNDLTI